MLTSELETLKQELDTYIATNIGVVFINKYRYGLIRCNSSINKLKELLLYKHVLTYWKQYMDGTPVPNVNYITSIELTNVVNRTKLLLRS
jgi:hypothetical protein